MRLPECPSRGTRDGTSTRCSPSRGRQPSECFERQRSSGVRRARMDIRDPGRGSSWNAPPGAMRRLKRRWRGLEITTRGSHLEAPSSRKSRTSRGTIVHNLPGGVRLQESATSIELLGEARAEALEQLVKVAKQRFGSKRVTLLASRRGQERLAELAAEQGLEIAEERQR